VARRVATLSVASAATLDLNDNDLVVTSGSTSQISTLIAQARHGGAWDQTGITSSAARSHPSHATTLGVLSGGEYLSANGAAFDDFDVAATDTLVKYTWYGDTDFNGKVNFDDYVRTDNGFNNHLSGWLNGDFDGNGAVNFDDYVLIDLAFNTQSGTLRRALAYLMDPGSEPSDPAVRKLADHAARFGGEFTEHFLAAVPEPGSAVGVFVLAGLCAANRRRVRSNSGR